MGKNAWPTEPWSNGLVIRCATPPVMTTRKPMTSDPLSDLASLLPRAIAWAENQSANILQTGQPLTTALESLASSVGVKYPEKIRIIEIPELPLPEDAALRDTGLKLGLLGPHMLGITFGYGIYVRQGHVDQRLLSHEFQHTYQYEQAGSIAAFLKQYIEQIAATGYFDAPLEQDARAHEVGHSEEWSDSWPAP
jgi:hypothetical protein